MSQGLLDEGFRAIAGRCPTNIVVQEEGKVLYLNQAARECLGYAEGAEKLGLQVRDLLDEPSYATLAPNFRRLDSDDDQLFMGELRLRHKSGTLIDAEVHHISLFTGDRQATLLTFRDITVSKKLDVEDRNSQKLESVGRLAAGIAHEINTPAQFVGDSIGFLSESFSSLQGVLSKYRELFAGLTAGPAYQQLAAELKQAEEAADIAFIEENAPAALERATEGISRIATIVSAMKEFAHPDQREKSPADLNKALQTTLTIARNEYKLVADVKTDLDDIPPVTCHVGDINQVFLNLIVNAAHAISATVGQSGKRGLIRIRTRQDGDAVRIEIADTGCGIPIEIRHRIFDPFFTTKPVGQGTGQGLAIARSVVVEKHGGLLTCESEVGVGTTFTVLLPIAPPQTPS